MKLLLYAAVIPYRPVLLQAKAIATLDQLSDGRLIVVAGSGWCADEFDRLGLDFRQRGPLTDEYLQAMIALWTEERPSFDGKYAQFDSVQFAPRCAQTPHVPIWVAGSGKRPLERLIAYGAGWAPMAGQLPELASAIAAIKRALTDEGRDTDAVEFSFGLTYGEPDRSVTRALGHVNNAHVQTTAATTQQTIESIAAHEAAGFTSLILNTAWETPADLCRRIEWFAGNVMPHFPDDARTPSG
ncbi:hypothetical protein ASE48_16230 [Mycobacterium sp. Root265]|nr:hypothetical protein ASE48_16230 [Mycobacterium sp. Root265]